MTLTRRAHVPLSKPEARRFDETGGPQPTLEHSSEKQVTLSVSHESATTC